MLAQEFHSILKENISSRGPAQALFEVTTVCLNLLVTSGSLDLGPYVLAFLQ